MIEREIDPKLWSEVQKLSEGNYEDKMRCIKIIFSNYFKLPKETNEVLKKMASSQNEEVKISIAKLLKTEHNISFGLYLELIDILVMDKNPEINKLLAKEVEENRKLALSLSSITNISGAFLKIAEQQRSVVASLGSLSIPRIEVPNIDGALLRIVEDQRRVIATLASLSAPQIAMPNYLADSLSQVMVSSIIDSNRINRDLFRGIAGISTSFFPEAETRKIDIIEKSKEEPLSKRLDSFPIDSSKWKEYQSLVMEVLDYSLVPPLESGIEESTSKTGAHRRDIVLHIPIDTSKFWEWIRNIHSAIGIIVDAKNFTDLIPADEVVTFAKYLSEKKLGLFGVIVTRFGFSEGAQKEQIRLWRDEDKMIVCLNDDDLRKMIVLKKNGEKPEIVIDRKIKEFREKLE